jgi:hypothetical protein
LSSIEVTLESSRTVARPWPSHLAAHDFPKPGQDSGGLLNFVGDSKIVGMPPT